MGATAAARRLLRVGAPESAMPGLNWAVGLEALRVAVVVHGVGEGPGFNLQTARLGQFARGAVNYIAVEEK